MTTIMIKSCSKCLGDMVSRYDEDPSCRICGNVRYLPPARKSYETPQERRRRTRRGFHVSYTGDHRNLAHLKVFVEPDRESRYYEIRCAFDGEVTRATGLSAYVGKDGLNHGGGYVCSERHLTRVQKDDTGVPVSWS